VSEWGASESKRDAMRYYFVCVLCSVVCAHSLIGLTPSFGSFGQKTNICAVGSSFFRCKEKRSSRLIENEEMKKMCIISKLFIQLIKIIIQLFAREEFE
jgi:transcription initiation factor TFIIIB Brf1 subunit/transcription initiation factor TFIIB